MDLNTNHTQILRGRWGEMEFHMGNMELVEREYNTVWNTNLAPQDQDETEIHDGASGTITYMRAPDTSETIVLAPDVRDIVHEPYQRLSAVASRHESNRSESSSNENEGLSEEKLQELINKYTALSNMPDYKWCNDLVKILKKQIPVAPTAWPVQRLMFTLCPSCKHCMSTRPYGFCPYCGQKFK